MGATVARGYQNSEREYPEADVNTPQLRSGKPSPTSCSPVMRNLNVELPGNLRQRPEVSPVSHRGNASPEELKSGEQWNSDVSIGYRKDSNNPAEATGQPSNQLPADGKLSLRGQATENVQGEKTCTVTVTVRIVGTTPFSIDTEELKAFAVKMFSTKNPNLQQEEPVSTAVPGTSSCPPP